MDFSALLNPQAANGQQHDAQASTSTAPDGASLASNAFLGAGSAAEAPHILSNPFGGSGGLGMPPTALEGAAPNGSPEHDDLHLAAEQAAGAAFANVYSTLGTLDGLDDLLDPSLGGFAAPPQEAAFPPDVPASLTAEQLALALPETAPSARGASPVSMASFVPDSEDEGGKVERGLGKARDVKLEGEEMDVDILGGADEGATFAALKAQAPSSSASASKPKPKTLTGKGKARATHLASGGTSPAPSPGPSSGLANEVLPGNASAASDSPSAASFSALPSAPPIAQNIHPSFLHTGSPSSFVHPRLRSPPPHPLPSAFEAYRPPKGGKANDDSDDEDGDEEQRRRERARRAAAAARGKKKRDLEEEDDGEEKDDRLYCICKELYNPERMMIACDKCEEWYHVDCVGIAEDAVELVDLFICPKCQASSLDRTTWKTGCRRPHCRKPAVPLSKYCSDYCGILVASARLSLLQDQTSVAPESFYPAVRSASRKEAAVTDQAVEGADARVFLSMEQRRAKQAAEWAREDAADEKTRGRLVEKLDETERRAERLREMVRMVELRVVYLRVAIKRWEALCQATADELQQAGIDLATAVAAGSGRRRGGGSKKKKGPVAATSLPDAQCGLDVRLVYDDKAWAAWVADVGPEGGRAVLEAQERGEDGRVLEMALEMLGGVCLETRKRCERHTGWQKVREADFQVEKAVMQRRLARLTSLTGTLSDQLASHDSTVSYRRTVRARTADPDRLIDVDDYIAEHEEAARSSRRAANGVARGVSPELGGEGGGGGGGGGRAGGAKHREISPELGAAGDEPYEIPADLLPFLSRAQIAAMKANRGRM
ncbi:hypothetical protein JCM6882_005488 [Rhodosporidiobolus microsporus]